MPQLPGSLTRDKHTTLYRYVHTNGSLYYANAPNKRQAVAAIAATVQDAEQARQRYARFSKQGEAP